MNEPAYSIWHGIGVCLPFGLMLGTLVAPARLSGVDFRQWFRDPSQPSAHADDSWIGLLINGIAIAFVSALVAVLLVALWVAWPHFPDWRACCLLVDVWDFVLGLLPYVAGFVAGIALAHAVAEMAWRFGLLVVPDAAPVARRLSANSHAALPDARERGGRRLIVCCDGTWNWPDRQRETNVVRFVRAISPQAQSAEGTPIAQISHYHLGVGTGNVLDRIVGGGLGIGLSNSVKSCYGFLVDNYAPGDEIFLFGFSRGAYVARSVAGMLGHVGILKRSEMERFIDAWDWYTGSHAERKLEALDAIAPNRYRSVDIECIGVWDTVGALGIPGTRFCAKNFSFHETALGEGVRHAFHALALDERRGNFQAAVWTPHPKPRSGQLLEQVWFPGVHSNIGGGYEQHGLSDTSMLWMLSRLRERDLLAIDMNYVDQVLDRSERYPVGVLAKSRTRVWRVIGSPVPRPAGITSDTEFVHESAWDRHAAGAGTLTRDIYQSPRRVRWLKAMNALVCQRSKLERDHAVQHPVPRTTSSSPLVSRKLGICDRVLTWLTGSA